MNIWQILCSWVCPGCVILVLVSIAVRIAYEIISGKGFDDEAEFKQQEVNK